jgi:energy-coupling factor transport system substrate-specific component
MTTPPPGPGDPRRVRLGATEAAAPSPRRTRLLGGAGALVIAATWAWIVLTQPGTLGTDLGYTTLGVLVGYLVGAVLIGAAGLPRLTPRLLVLVPAAVALNIVLGQVVGTVPIPLVSFLYLDTIGTVLVGLLGGPLAGATTGVLTNLVWGLLGNPSAIPFAAGSALVGAVAGWAARSGAARRLWTFVLCGFAAGLGAGILGAPVAAYVFGGGLGVGTGSLVAVLQATGQSMLGATTLQSLLSDPLDKAVTFLLVWAAVRLLPRRATAGLPMPADRLPRRRRARGPAD